MKSPSGNHRAEIKYTALLILLFFQILPAAGQLTGNWVLEHADEARGSYREGASTSEFFGNVIIRNGDDSFQADYFFYDEKPGLILLRGNVNVATEGYMIKSDRLVYMISSETGTFTGSVLAGRDDAEIRSDKAVYHGGTGVMEFFGNVDFCRKDQHAFAEYLYYSHSEGLIVLEGCPYLSMDDDYAGGDRITIETDKDDTLKNVTTLGHGDLYWTGDKQTIELKAREIIMFFSKGDITKVEARGDAVSNMKEENSESSLSSDAMDVFFSEGEVSVIKVRGNSKGKRIVMESGDEDA